MTLRSPMGWSAASEVPQRMQKRASSGFVAPQVAQAAVGGGASGADRRQASFVGNLEGSRAAPPDGAR